MTTFFAVTVRKSYGPDRTPYRLVLRVQPAAGKPGHFYASGAGLGCGKDYASEQTAIRELCNAEALLVSAAAPVPADAQGVEILKHAGLFDEAGRLAFAIRLGRSYGCHYGMRSTREAAVAAFQAGWDNAELDAAFAAIPVVHVPEVTEAEFEAQQAEAAQQTPAAPRRAINHLFFQDAGHGWLRVPLRTIKAHGLTERDFSAYSYWTQEGGETVCYLEEDCDMTRWAVALKHQGIELDFTTVDQGDRSPIRSLPRMPGRR